eukprot:TRINITY_DN1363_c0_g1_i4.p4 TRINITY_DN1363_c0_g1~~TRINITY_DN1363_c0_g1_i4.p4  ORF type:complete len:203 (-),score=40.96 TRINITY_DN1363_c0_g1_i4:703-1311(-)
MGRPSPGRRCGRCCRRAAWRLPPPPSAAFRTCPALAREPPPPLRRGRATTPPHYQSSAPSTRNCCCWYKGPASALAPTKGAPSSACGALLCRPKTAGPPPGGYTQTIHLDLRPAGGGGPTLRTSGGGGFSAGVNGRTLRVAGATRKDFVDYFPHLLARVERLVQQGPLSCAPEAAQLGAVVTYLRGLAWEYGLSTTVGCPLN